MILSLDCQALKFAIVRKRSQLLFKRPLPPGTQNILHQGEAILTHPCVLSSTTGIWYHSFSWTDAERYSCRNPYRQIPHDEMGIFPDIFLDRLLKSMDAGLQIFPIRAWDSDAVILRRIERRHESKGSALLPCGTWSALVWSSCVRVVQWRHTSVHRTIVMQLTWSLLLVSEAFVRQSLALLLDDVRYLGWHHWFLQWTYVTWLWK
jgi:hypothetical protein